MMQTGLRDNFAQRLLTTKLGAECKAATLALLRIRTLGLGFRAKLSMQSLIENSGIAQFSVGLDRLADTCWWLMELRTNH